MWDVGYIWALGACPFGCLLTLPFRNPAGGLPFWLPAYPAFSFLFCPHPPDPLPGGKGENQSIFRRGLPPPAPLQPGGKRHWLCFWKTVLLAFRGKFSTAGKESNAAGDANTIGDSPCRTPTPKVQQVPHGFRLRGCKGRSPLHKITFSLPLPAGKSALRARGWGDGGKIFLSPQKSCGQVEPMPHGYKPDSKPAAEAAKPILQNPKSQPPSGTARKPQVRAPT